MTAQKTTPKQKIKTLDEFAAVIHKDYLAISEKMATRNDIQQIREEMAASIYQLSQTMATKAELREIREDLKRVTDMLVSKADLEALRDELVIEIKHGKTADELRERLAVVEEKLGIKHSHRIA